MRIIVLQAKQELLTLLEYLNLPPVFSGIRVTRPLVLCVMFCRSLFVLLCFTIVVSGLLISDSDYPIGIFKLFLTLSDVWMKILVTLNG